MKSEPLRVGKKPFCVDCRRLLERNLPPNLEEWQRFKACRCLEVKYGY